jgi:hypothetical protein
VIQRGLVATLTGIVTAWSTALVITQPSRLASSAIKTRLQRILKQLVFIGAFSYAPDEQERSHGNLRKQAKKRVC